MISKPLLFWGSVFLSLFTAERAAAEKIIIASDPWCPYVCDPESDAPGFMIEVAREIFQPFGLEVEQVNLNWARALQEVRKGNIHAVAGAFHGDAPDFVFPAKPQALIGNAFFVTQANPWQYTDLSSLEEIKLGAIIDYDYGPELNRYINEKRTSYQVQLFSGAEDTLKRGIRMLQMNRIDVMVESEAVFWYTAASMRATQQFRKAGQMNAPEPAFIAFSPAKSSSLHFSRLLSEGMEPLRTSGKLAEILAKYGLKE